jgi:hypothetical protein
MVICVFNTRTPLIPQVHHLCSASAGTLVVLAAPRTLALSEVLVKPRIHFLSNAEQP